MDMPDIASSFHKSLNYHPSTGSMDSTISKRCYGYTDFNAIEAVRLLNSYSRNQPSFTGVFDSIPTMQLSRDFASVNPSLYTKIFIQTILGPTFVVCSYCNLPGHIAKYCTYPEQLQRRQPLIATFTGIRTEQVEYIIQILYEQFETETIQKQ